MMTREEMLKKFEEIADEKQEELKAAGSVEEIREILVANGMDAPADEIDGMVIALAERCGEGELSEEEMEQVVGGGLLDYLSPLHKLYNAAKYTWEIGTWVSGKMVYGSQEKAKQGIINYWKNFFS